jgi:hypothetical protein
MLKVRYSLNFADFLTMLASILRLELGKCEKILAASVTEQDQEATIQMRCLGLQRVTGLLVQVVSSEACIEAGSDVDQELEHMCVALCDPVRAASKTRPHLRVLADTLDATAAGLSQLVAERRVAREEEE